jgi:hypothetical protein
MRFMRFMRFTPQRVPVMKRNECAPGSESDAPRTSDGPGVSVPGILEVVRFAFPGSTKEGWQCH